MNIGEFLDQSTKALRDAGIETARLDCLIALEDETGQSRAWILAHPEAVLDGPRLASLNNFITQRINHLPVSYYRGHSQFYGRSFIVNEHVLVPRSETESIIDLLKTIDLPTHTRIADIGTGSGCIGITAALEIPGVQVSLFDIDESALQVAKQNMAQYSVDARVQRQDLLGDQDESFDVILANLPYVPDDYPINRAASYEPPIALFSGKDGMDHYRKLWKQIRALTDKPSFVLTESLLAQHKTLTKLAHNAGYGLFSSDNYAQVFRYVGEA